VKQRPRPESDWKRIDKAHWRIVPDDLWNRVTERRKDVEAMSVRLSGGRLSGRPPKGKTLNLLAGIAKCGICGGGLTVETYFTKQGQPRPAHTSATVVGPATRARTRCACRWSIWRMPS
jgi:hypothetical protein